MDNNKKKIAVIGAFLILMIFLIGFLHNSTNRKLYYNIMNLANVPEEGVTSDGVIRVGPDTDLSEKGLIARIDPIHLSRGNYRIKVDHQGDTDFKAIIRDEENVIQDVYLSKTETETWINISLPKDVYSFQMDFIYPGDGEVVLKHAEIIGDPFIYSDILFLSLSLSLLAAILTYFKIKDNPMSRTDQDNLVIMGMIGFGVFLNYPIFYPFIQRGGDIAYHLSRIEGIATELKRGQFPVQIYFDAHGGRTYLGTLYPSLFLYIPALLRVLRVSISLSFKAFQLLMNIGSMYTSYLCGKTVSGQKIAGVFFMVLYCLMPYRLSCMYFRDALGESQALVFVPLIITGLYEIIQGNRRKWWLLAIGMSGVLESHVITAVFGAGICLIFCLIYVKKLYFEKRYKEFIYAAAFSVLLNIGMLVSFIYYYTSDIDWSHLAIADFGTHGIFPTQLFMLMAAMGDHSTNVAELGIVDEDSLSMGLSVLVCILLSFYVFFTKRTKDERDRYGAAALGTGFILLYMSTTWFPWKAIQNIKPIKGILQMIQFPLRFLGVAETLIICAAAIFIFGYEYLQRHMKLIFIVLIFVAMMQSMVLTDSFLMTNERVGGPYMANIDNRFYGDYVPEGYDKTRFPDGPMVVGEKDTRIHSYYHDGPETRIEYSSEMASDIDVPLIYYRGYKAYDKEGQRVPVSKGEAGMIRLSLPAAEDGYVRLSYAPPIVLGLMAYFSIAVFIISMSLLIKNKGVLEFKKNDLISGNAGL